MAGEWIKMRADLRDDPAVFRLAEILGVDELHVVGALFCFWSWADRHSVDGRVDGASSRVIDKTSMTPGFADAMASVGWLVIDGTGVSIPRFGRHNGESAKERGQKNARQARWRAKRDADVDGKTSTRPSTKASTREEKRREEKDNYFCAAPRGDATPNEAGSREQTGAGRGNEDERTPVASLPLIDGSAFAVSDREADEWARAYPAVDVPQQLAAMGAWLDANPRNRKTPGGIKRFVVGWLAKEQNRAARAPGGSRSEGPKPWEGAI